MQPVVWTPMLFKNLHSFDLGRGQKNGANALTVLSCRDHGCKSHMYMGLQVFNFKVHARGGKEGPGDLLFSSLALKFVGGENYQL
jgi:hypothetical protein